MSYAANEVKLNVRRLTARGSEPLPRAGSGLFVILSEENEDASESAGWIAAMAEIRRRQSLRGHKPRSAEMVAKQILDERECWI